MHPAGFIVIEGFPRSAKSKVPNGFIACQDKPLHVAHEQHHAAQVLRAADWQIPAVVLIRPPKDACLSLIALAAEARHRKGKAALGALTFQDAVHAYVTFYEAVEPRLDEAVIGRFDVGRNDIAGLVTRVNAHFSTYFRVSSEYKVRSDLGWHAMPNEIRTKIKRELSGRFDSELKASASFRRLLSRAETVHARYEERNEHTS